MRPSDILAQHEGGQGVQRRAPHLPVTARVPDFGQGAVLVSRSYNEIVAQRTADAKRVAAELVTKRTAEIGWVTYRVVTPIRPENRHRYPADWKQISERIRFVRAAGRCECLGECGRTHDGRCPNRHGGNAYGTGSKVVLTVAHLNHIPEDCADANLKAMCQGCHLHYDKDYHAETAARTRTAALVSQMDGLFEVSK